MARRIPTVTTRQGMAMISLYLGSLGRYGPAAYLCAKYGASEVRVACVPIVCVGVSTRTQHTRPRSRHGTPIVL